MVAFFNTMADNVNIHLSVGAPEPSLDIFPSLFKYDATRKKLYDISSKL